MFEVNSANGMKSTRKHEVVHSPKLFTSGLTAFVLDSSTDYTDGIQRALYALVRPMLLICVIFSF